MSYIRRFALCWLGYLGLVVSGFAQSEIIYCDTVVPRIDIYLPADTLTWIYHNPYSDIEHLATFRFRSGNLDVAIDSIGFRLRGNTSREAAKKSFKVSFNTFHKGRKFLGVEKLNLNGEHNDPSIIRSKFCFDLFHDAGIVASRAAHAQVYINDQYYGLYINVEHVDEEFLKNHLPNPSGNLWKCLYPADLTYRGSQPDDYRSFWSGGRPVYELKTNEDAADFTRFARFVSLLNLTPVASFPDSLEKIADIENILSYFAMDVLLGSWDDYRALMNNYYLYDNPATGKFMIIPYDYDNTFGIDWFSVDWATANPYDWPRAVAGSRPLADRMLQNAQYRDLFTHFLRFYSQRVLSLGHWDSRLQRLKEKITPFVAADTWRTLDYGFTMDDFHNSYTGEHYENQHVKRGIREFVNARMASLQSQLSYLNAPPVVYCINPKNPYPLPGSQIEVECAVFAASGIKNVVLLYREQGQTAVNQVPMFYTPDTSSPMISMHDRWMGTLAALPEGRTLEFRIRVTDSLNQSKAYPLDGWLKATTVSSDISDVRINELMASNAHIIADPAGEFDDWVELYNSGSLPVLLAGAYLSDKPTDLRKWAFPSETVILPGQYLLVWCDEDPYQPGIHADFKLSASGESIILTAQNGVSIVDRVDFGPQSTDVSLGRIPDATGSFISLSPSPGYRNSAAAVFSAPEAIPFRVYFDPAARKLHLTLSKRINPNITLYLVDITGRVVAYDNIPSNSLVWSVEAAWLESGWYFISLTSDKGKSVQKVWINP
ncbi:MAG: T9SS type A sorting domain-containing protein [Bacteroidales bacterium]|jgi:hypothetical protein|nr:T9SS type A sorting domain-containing protein [Bacteroidales bacterium]NPV37086.1 T9SS type A sorting domain-containing protein [Bacteroidales bacterium]